MPGGWELIVIVLVVVLLFGAKKLPEMARSMGQSARVFKGEMKGMKADDESTAEATGEADKTPPALPASPASTPPEQARTAQPGSDTTR